MQGLILNHLPTSIHAPLCLCGHFSYFGISTSNSLFQSDCFSVSSLDILCSLVSQGLQLLREAFPGLNTELEPP